MTTRPSAALPSSAKASGMPNSRGWAMVAAGALVIMVVVVFARLSYGFILPFMRSALGLSYQQAGTLGTASALGYLLLIMVAGMVASRWGGRLAVLSGVAMTMAGFGGLALASDYRLLVALMALLGFGTAFSYTPVISLLAAWFPERRGAVIGIANSGVGLGLLLSGSLVPALHASYAERGWRIAWALFALTALVALVAGFFLLRNPVGAGPTGTHKVDKAKVFRNSHVITVGLLYGIVGITYIVQAIFMYSFALESGVPALTAGRLAAVTGILSIFSSPCWGWLSDRYGRALVLRICVSMTLLGILIPVVTPTLGGFAAHFLIVGCTLSGMFGAILAASTETVGPHEAPLAVSFVTLFYAVGQFAGPAAAGLLIEHAGGFRSAFAACCMVLAAGVGLTLRLGRARR
ncbi:MFS transporter [Noviherbaspirillum suwonense]|jgi:MFS family permease|uniref:Nitrate/nitrite transporter NarK n=1 Tax=Noviherbaspirillum suwonense TaxID=1224511 RepID=A0ABY1QTC1_9BURK|nr:MFS transporter [Noviherbaspirillum suwonense]SMP78270.1 Nitrate/nitrite transporter NarK [Noviherbaspirillum suwonense]